MLAALQQPAGALQQCSVTARPAPAHALFTSSGATTSSSSGLLSRCSRRRSGGSSDARRRGQRAVSMNSGGRFRDPLAANESLPLHDKRVLITAPRQYATKLSNRLLAAGARPLWLPTIQISALRDEQMREDLDAALHDLTQYDHLAFPSRNAITAVMDALEGWLGSAEAAAEHIRKSGIKCWALGADAEALIELGVPEVHTPQEPSTQGLVAELVRRGEAEGRRVLCPVPRVLPPLVEPEVVPRFLAALEQAGAEPWRVNAYETGVGCAPSSCTAEWELLMEGEIHAIAFSSTAEAQGLVQLMGGSPRFVHQAVRAHNVLLAAHGPYTAAGAASVLGVPITCVSRDSSTFDGLVEALASTLAGRVGSPGMAKALALRRQLQSE